MNWISVKDKLPEDDVDNDFNDCSDIILVYPKMSVCRFTSGKFFEWLNWDYAKLELTNVTHWIYLEDIPKP